MQLRMPVWRGDDDARRLDSATFRLRRDRLEAIGSSRTAGYVSRWSLTTGAGWVTQVLDIDVTGFGWSRSLHLERRPDVAPTEQHDAALWTAETTVIGESDLPDPGIEDAAALSRALDCDIALCPATNTMPILRLRLLAGPVAPVQLTMAWVDLPSLRVIASPQIYSSRDVGGPHPLVTYTSGTRDFTADLDVNADGIVQEYPGLAHWAG